MRNSWASFESAISTPSVPNYSFPSSSASNIASPAISPRSRTTNPSFFSTPATPSSSSTYPSSSSASLSSPPFNRTTSTSSYRPSQSPFPHSSNSSYTSSYTSSSSTATSSLPPSTPASSRPSSFLATSTPTSTATPLPFSTYRTFPSLSGRKDHTTTTTTTATTTAAFDSTRTTTAAATLNGATAHQPHDTGVRYMRSLASPAGTAGLRRTVVFASGVSLSSGLSTAVLSGMYASVQELLHGSASYAQYIVWKLQERQTKLTAFLCYYCPLLLLLLSLFTFHLSRYSSLLVFACALSLVVSHSVRSLLSAHVLTAARPIRPAWQRLFVPFVSSDDVMVACVTLLCSVVTVVAMSWLSSPRSTADSGVSGDYARQLLWFTLCGASAFEVWWLFHHLPLPLRPVATSSLVSVRYVLQSCLLPSLSTSVASAARVVAVCVVAFGLCRVVLCLGLGVCASVTVTSGWWLWVATILRLFRIVFVLRLCSTLSYRLLALFLSRSSHFPLSYLLMALYDHYDSLSRYLSFSFLSSFLASPSNRLSLLVPLSAILPDVRPPPSSPATTAVDAVMTAALHAIAQWVEGRKRSVVEAQRMLDAETSKEKADVVAASRQQWLWWLERARDAGRLLLWQEVEVELAEDEGELESGELVAAAASILASLLSTLDVDRQRLIEPYVSHALTALSELADTCAMVGAGQGVAGLGRVAEESLGRAASGLKGKLGELELPAKHRERVERAVRQQP